MSVDKFPTWGQYGEYDNLYFRLMSKLTGIEGYPPAGDRTPDLWSVEKNHQRLISEVCRLTGLTPQQWGELSQPELCPWLERALELVHGHADQDGLGALSDETMLTHKEIANKLSIKSEIVRKRLDRWRMQNKGSGWQEVSNAKANEPKYLYNIGAIRHVLSKLLGPK